MVAPGEALGGGVRRPPLGAGFR